MGCQNCTAILPRPPMWLLPHPRRRDWTMRAQTWKGGVPCLIGSNLQRMSPWVGAGHLAGTTMAQIDMIWKMRSCCYWVFSIAPCRSPLLNRLARLWEVGSFQWSSSLHLEALMFQKQPGKQTSGRYRWSWLNQGGLTRPGSYRQGLKQPQAVGLVDASKSEALRYKSIPGCAPTCESVNNAAPCFHTVEEATIKVLKHR